MQKTNPLVETNGYTSCGCPSCFEIAIGAPGALCHACTDAGCDCEGSECQVEAEDDGEADVDLKVLALSKHLGVHHSTISEGCWFTSTDAPGEFMVLTDDERKSAADEALDSYLDECVLNTIPESLRCYFDAAAWKRDAILSDGYGHTLSSYDGEEHEVRVEGEFVFIYRTN